MRHGAVTMFAADKAKLDREMSSPETIYKTMTSSDDGDVAAGDVSRSSLNRSCNWP
jgi:hypothetical protein